MISRNTRRVEAFCISGGKEFQTSKSTTEKGHHQAPIFLITYRVGNLRNYPAGTHKAGQTLSEETVMEVSGSQFIRLEGDTSLMYILN